MQAPASALYDGTVNSGLVRREENRAPALSARAQLVRRFGLRAIRIGAMLDRVRTIEAHTTQECEDVYRLRYEVYRDAGFIEPKAEERFADSFDEYSVSLLARRRGQTAGTLRLILGGSPRFERFWTEALFNIDRLDVPRVQTAEVSRLAVRRTDRGCSNWVVASLLANTLEYCTRESIRYLYVNCPDALLRHMSTWGLPFHTLPERPPEPQHLAARQLIGGYFAQKKLKPKYLDLDEVRAILAC